MLDLATWVHYLVYHTISETQVYPTLAAGVNVLTDNAADWTLGAYATVVAASTITSRFHVHSVTIESCSTNGVFQLELYRGATDNLIAGVRFAVVGGFWGNSYYAIGSEVCEANDQIRARVASDSVVALGQATVGISISYCIEE